MGVYDNAKPQLPLWVPESKTVSYELGIWEMPNFLHFARILLSQVDSLAGVLSHFTDVY